MELLWIEATPALIRVRSGGGCVFEDEGRLCVCVCVCVCVGWGLEKEGMGLICNRMITGWPAALAQHVHLVLFQKHLCKGTMNCMFLVNSLKFM